MYHYEYENIQTVEEETKIEVNLVLEVLHGDSLLLQLFESSQPIDLLTVSSQLRKNQKLDIVGGDFYLIGLTQKVSSSAHIEFHARIILQKFIQRSLIKISNETTI